MSEDTIAAPDLSGRYWVLFRSTGKDTFEYREALRGDKRAILVFTSQDKALALAAQDNSYPIASQFSKEFRPITLESLDLWRDFFRRRTSEGVNFVEVDPNSTKEVTFQTSTDQFIALLENQFES